jgi:hypothetical protein
LSFCLFFTCVVFHVGGQKGGFEMSVVFHGFCPYGKA